MTTRALAAVPGDVIARPRKAPSVTPFAGTATHD